MNRSRGCMRKTIFFLFFMTFLPVVFAIDTAYGAADEITSYTKEKLITQIEKPQSPFVKDNFIVFTADKNARFVGIAFEYENFRIIHPFQRLSHYETDDKPVDSVLFYVASYPKELEQISYRLVIDGLWTTDPMNPHTVYDQKTKAVLSTIKIESVPDPVTEKLPSGVIRFVYYGQTGQQIRLGGSFNNWDSFMYTLREVSYGMYQIDLALPAGTHYYNFYNGMNAIVDTKNPDRVFTVDGKVASMIVVR